MHPKPSQFGVHFSSQTTIGVELRLYALSKHKTQRFAVAFRSAVSLHIEYYAISNSQSLAK
jgi:hypothetical protein